MTGLKWIAFGLCVAALSGMGGPAAKAAGRYGPGLSAAPAMPVEPAQLQGLLELFADDDEPYRRDYRYGYDHDRHYDFDQYRNATSRKERVRDYYRMQTEMQKDYWKSQKQLQKNAIKRQRGW